MAVYVVEAQEGSGPWIEMLLRKGQQVCGRRDVVEEMGRLLRGDKYDACLQM